MDARIPSASTAMPRFFRVAKAASVTTVRLVLSFYQGAISVPDALQLNSKMT